MSIRDTELEERAARTQAALDEINAEYWGIPAATLAGLRDGSLVAVPRKPIEVAMALLDAPMQTAAWHGEAAALVDALEAMLAAAKEPPHEA